MGEHPGCHPGHLKSELKRKQENKQLLKRVSIYKQLHAGVHTQALKIKQRNCAVIKEFLNTTYFAACKKRAVRENVSDIIHFLKGLGNEDILFTICNKHQQGLLVFLQHQLMSFLNI